MRYTKSQGKQTSKETKQSSESNSNVTQIMELSGQKLKIAMVNMLRALMEKNRQYTGANI